MQDYDELQVLLDAKEGENIQFKEAKNRFGFNEAGKYCSALANNGGGRLVLGVTDKRPRQIVGSQAFEQPERTRNGLKEKLGIMIDFQLLEHEGNRILVFIVPSHPDGLPVQFEGTAWWNDGDSLVPMSEETRRKIYNESEFDFSGSICAGASINDLDESAINVFRTKWMEKSGNERIQSYTIEQVLLDCGAITDDGVTYAALILFGKKNSLRKFLPQAEIIFEYRSTEASGPANQREEFRVGFFSCFDQIWDLINLRNDKQHYQEGFFVYDIPTFNERVIREAILNAVSHRNYQLGGSVFIRQFPDRLVVESPGGFPLGISLENILDRQSPRNRCIAEMLSLCGLVERSGQGMNLIYELSVREAKQLPDFTGTDDDFVSIALNGLVLDKDMLSVINRISSEHMDALNTNDFLVIDALYHNKTLSKTLKSRLQHLTEMGIVEHIGRNKYVLARSLYDSVGQSGVYTRLIGLDKETNKELIVKHIQSNGNQGTKFKEIQQVLPGQSRGQIQELMNELYREGRIYHTGNTSASKWFINTSK